MSGDRYPDGREKEYQFIQTKCKGCGIDMTARVFIDATAEEMAVARRKFCDICDLRAKTGNFKPYVCAYCSHGYFTLTQVTNPEDGSIFTEARCGKCRFNEQKLGK
jgi:ribosomal protein S27E